MKNKQEGIYYGYIMVIAIFFIITIVEGLMYCFGIFFKPLQNEFGWSSTQVSLAFTLFMILHGMFYIVTGRISDRFGPRLVVTVCGFFLGAGYLLLSRINALWQLCILYGLILAIGTSGAYVPLISTINRWFVNKRSLMTGICSAGAGVGTMIVPPIASRLISTFGWRQSSLIVGLASLILIGVIAQLLKRDPGKIKQSIDQTDRTETKKLENPGRSFSLRQSVLTPQFWILTTAFFGFGFCLQAVMVHIVPYAITLGNPLTEAAIIMAFIGGASTVGRVTIGAAADRLGNKPVTIISFILLTFSLCFLLFSKKIEMFYIFAVIFGFGYGGLVAMSSLQVADLFGLRNHGLIFGVLAFIITLGGGVGPLAAGYIYDLSNSYHLLLFILLAVSITGSLLILLLSPISQSKIPK